MKKLKYKFVKLPEISRKQIFFSNVSNINDVRIPKLEAIFNDLSKNGWILVEIYWTEGLAMFSKEIL